MSLSASLRIPAVAQVEKFNRDGIKYIMNKEIANKVVDIVYDSFDSLEKKHGYQTAKKIWYQRMEDMQIDAIPEPSFQQDSDAKERGLCQGQYAMIVMPDGIKMIDPFALDFSMLFIPTEIAIKIATLNAI